MNKVVVTQNLTNTQTNQCFTHSRCVPPNHTLISSLLCPCRVAMNHHTSLAAVGKHPPLFTPPPHFSTLTQHVMTGVSTQVKMIHRVCSHQAANFFCSSSSSHVASFLARFTGSKFLPISSSAYGSEVWDFQQ